jgi:hypothetical protein
MIHAPIIFGKIRRSQTAEVLPALRVAGQGKPLRSGAIGLKQAAWY